MWHVDIKHGHVFEMKPNSVKSGHWCPDCRYFLNESKCSLISEQLTGKQFKSSKRELQGFELDGCNSELGIAFEYNGIQQYQYVEFFHRTEDEFKKRGRIR